MSDTIRALLERIKHRNRPEAGYTELNEELDYEDAVAALKALDEATDAAELGGIWAGDIRGQYRLVPDPEENT